MTEFEEIIKWHPQIVLTSEKPATWHGLMIINNYTQIEILLKVPNYPSFKDASVQFGDKVSLTYGTDFPDKLSTLLHNASSVSSFLTQLQRVLNNIIQIKPLDNKVKADCSINIRLRELKTAMAIPDVIFSANNNLSIIKLTYNDISIQLKQDPTGYHSWVVFSSDLPESKAWEPLDTCVTSLSKAAEELKTRTDLLKNTWLTLNDIDRNCWVLEPSDPKPYQLHRRIYISPALSILLTLDPTNTESLREIKVFGSDSEVAKCHQRINQNLNNWNASQSIIDNLMEVLEIDELPKRPSVVPSQNAHNGLFSDSDCSICFSRETDTEEHPSAVCNNVKCQKNFHQRCLLRWLQSVAGNTTAFDRIHGVCPSCSEKISCRMISNSDN